MVFFVSHQHLSVQIDPQLSQHIPFLEAEPEPALRSRGPRQQTPSTVDSSPPSSPALTVAPASPPARRHFRLPPHACLPTSNEPSIIPESQAAVARAEYIINREIHARRSNAHARTEMTRKYNKHHQVQPFVVGRYVTAIFPAWTVLPQINEFSHC